MARMVSRLIIEGGRPLSGEVAAAGAKNSATKLMVASLLTEEPVVLYNLPLIGDVDITRQICEEIGAQLDISDHTLTIHTPRVNRTKVREQTRRNRLSVLALGPLLHRAGTAELPVVGGDKLGARPVDYHINALRQMGVQIEETANGYLAKTTGLKGAKINLPYPSVGATENILLAAVLASGRTTISNAAIEPEVVEMVMMLQRMGAIIEFRANRAIVIDGVKRLHGTSYTIMPDRLEVASWGLLALATNGRIAVDNCRQTHLVTFLNTVRRLGADYHIAGDTITFKRSGQTLRPIEIVTDVWPGFSSDWQQPLGVVLTQAAGRSVIHETVYSNRFEYTKTLTKMGAKIELFDARKSGLGEQFDDTHYSQSAQILGPTPLHAAEIDIPDIRAGMAQVIAALSAKGSSAVNGVEHLLRGYEEPLAKLKAVGAIFRTAED